jgi:hypothetical protein
VGDFSLHQLQKRLQWDMKSYSAEYLASNLQHRDFQHALLHLDKAIGKLSAMVEEADHRHVQDFEPFPVGDVEKYLADVVICALRMAETNPSGHVDLERSVLARIQTKEGLTLLTPAE